MTIVRASDRELRVSYRATDGIHPWTATTDNTPHRMHSTISPLSYGLKYNRRTLCVPFDRQHV